MERHKPGSDSYYTILGVGSDCSAEEIRRAYRRLAMRWHPDRWARRRAAPALLSKAKAKFQQIQQAYSVLSDQRKRALYDAGFYNDEDDDDDEHNEAFYEFMQEMVSLMAKARSEDCKCATMEELQTMFMEMAQGF
ncbi:chaperone protein DnaJ-like isoform X1 [Cucurbita moschata]|uniref:Chaperone protein DnaJ-like isoform X1 n=1 Tax=Cucurbita moschata TaxID=3662 RepID=A0A6J1FGZ8_CUCMO|nr:chaperone protein DnaJ-like isoform X1 [Cucurbita moschata]